MKMMLLISILLLVFIPIIIYFIVFPGYKSSNIESGFDSMNKTALYFSIQFLYLIIIFILFDLEILFLFTLLFNPALLIPLFIFFTFLVEWFYGSLKWLT